MKDRMQTYVDLIENPGKSKLAGSVDFTDKKSIRLPPNVLNANFLRDSHASLEM